MPKIVGRSKVWMGIDPGLSGGIAMLHEGILTSVPMPQTERDLLEVINAYPGSQIVAVVELVHAMPLNGSISAFKLGMNYGSIRMALVASRARFETVSPMKWQKALGLPTKKKTESKSVFKGRLKAKAQELWPDERVTLATSDALLLLEYCLRVNNGKEE